MAQHINEHLTVNNNQSGQSYTVPLVFMISLFFMFGFITALNDILIPHLKGLFMLTNLEAQLVQLCFFGAYFIMSIPSGWIISKIGYKKGIVIALGGVGTGLLLFVPASMIVSYPFFLFALFVVGSSITVLQVAANPYIGALGNPETAAARLNLAGVFNSLGTTIGPWIGAFFIFIGETASQSEKAEAVRVPYIGLALFAALLAFLIYLSKLPAIEYSTSETVSDQKNIFSYRHLILGAVAIFFYVGAEVTIGSHLIEFLAQPDMGGYSQLKAAEFVSYYWGGAMAGRIIGIFVLMKVKADKGLAFVSAAALLLVSIGMLTNGIVSAVAIVAIGLFNSVMWPCIFPLALKGLGKNTSRGSGILVTMVVGGAIIPLVQGFLADALNYHMSFGIVFICYAYLLYFGLVGHKQVN